MNLSVILLSTAIVGSDFSEAERNDWAILNGTWSMVAVEIAGEQRDSEGKRIVIKNGEVTILDGTKNVGQLEFAIDPTTKPKSATATYEVKDLVMSIVAIYTVQGDKLKVCVNGVRSDLAEATRPKAFDSKEGFLITLTRIRGEDVPMERVAKEGVLRNSLGMELVRIPSGEFAMGSITSGIEDERRHRVRISRHIHMLPHEVTRDIFQRVMNDNFLDVDASVDRSSGGAEKDQIPISNVTWHDAVEFCQRLSSVPEEIKAGHVYRLPTEAEWEYACRAGSNGPFSTGRLLTSSFARFATNDLAAQTVNPETGPFKVGSFLPNSFGMYDMYGNVAEWCGDWYGDYYTQASILENPQGPLTGVERVIRGGSFQSSSSDCRSAARDARDPRDSHPSVGFRVVCELMKPQPDISRIAESAIRYLDSCIWEYQEIHRTTEHPSRYAAVLLSPQNNENGKRMVRVFMRHDVKNGVKLEGHGEWAMRGDAVIETSVTGSGEVRVHLYLFMTDILVREVEGGRVGEWQKRTRFTEPVLVELKGIQPPELFEREFTVILGKVIRIDDDLKLVKDSKGKPVELESFGWVHSLLPMRMLRKTGKRETIHWMEGGIPDPW